MTDDLFAQEHPVQIQLVSKGFKFAYEVVLANGYTLEWVYPDDLWKLLQENCLYWKNGRGYVVCDRLESESPYGVGEYVRLRDVTDIVQEFREATP